MNDLLRLFYYSFYLQAWCGWHGYWKWTTETTIELGVHWRGSPPSGGYLRIVHIQKISENYWWFLGKRMTMQEMPLSDDDE